MEIGETSDIGRLDPAQCAIWLNLDHALEYGPEMFRLAMLSYAVPLGDDHKRYVSSCRSQMQRASAVNAFTTYSHETRHFHDMLATPYGSFLARQYAGATLEFCSLQSDILLQLPSIYIPLKEWAINADFLAEAFPGLAKPTPRLVQASASYDELSKKLAVFNSGSSAEASALGIDARGLLESSAIAMQELEIRIAFGDDSAADFRHAMLSGPAGPHYYTAYRLLNEAAEGNLSLESIILCVIASLCGDFQERNPDVPRYPADLFCLILGIVKETAQGTVWKDPEHTLAVLDSLWTRLQGRTLAEAIRSSASINEIVLRRFANGAEQLSKSSSRYFVDAQVVVDWFADFCRLQEQMTSIVSNDILSYCSADYGVLQRQLPVPIMIITTDVGLPLSSGEEPFDEGFQVLGALSVPVRALEGHPMWNTNEWSSDETVRVVTAFTPRKPLLAVSNVNPEYDRWMAYLGQVAGLRLLLEGRSALRGPWVDEYLMLLDLFGTEVLAADGKVSTPALSLAASPTIEQLIKELPNRQPDFDPVFREFIEAVRSRKKAR